MAGKKVALIFGASGVSGWSFVSEILRDYPREGIWAGCYALTSRPLTVSQACWPSDERLRIVSGIDLLEGEWEDLRGRMREIAGIETVTHLYYLGEQTHRPTGMESN
jgi:hypothetical protein